MQSLQEKLFRKVALERLSSPEQLDQLMRVVPPLGWLALVPLLGLLFLAILWGWFGSVATSVGGKCMLMSPLGLGDVSSVSGGRITETLVRVGDTVKANQIVARVAQSELADRVDQGRQTTAVSSPYDGRVVDIKIGVGSLIAPGGSLMTVEKASGEAGGLQAVIYLPAAEGGRVRTGMTAQVTPSTVKREEHGFILAEVAYVSDYPATPQSMMLLLQNETLVKELMGDSPPKEIRATLVPDGNASGYRWASPAGSSVAVKSGTPCTAEIVVERQRPLSLVIPALKKPVAVH